MWCCRPKVHLCDPHLTATVSSDININLTSLSRPALLIGFLTQFLTLKNIQLAPIFRHSTIPDQSQWQQGVLPTKQDTLRPLVIQKRLT